MTDSNSLSASNLSVFGSAPTVDRLVDDIRDAAEHGFGTYWMPQIFGLDALTALAVATREVPDIRVGTAVIPTWPRHPMMLAQQALTLNQVAGGRLDLGIGLSHKPVVEGMWGIPFESPVGHMADYLKILMPLLCGDKVSHSGGSLTGRGEIEVRGDAPPVYVAALGEQMLNVAGRHADGTVLWMTGTETIRGHTVPTINAAAEAAGRPTPAVIAAAPVCLAESDDEVAALRERAAQEYVIYGQLPSYRAMLDREGLSGPEDLALIGDLDHIAAGFQRFLDAGTTMAVANVFGSAEQQAATRAALATLL